MASRMKLSMGAFLALVILAGTTGVAWRLVVVRRVEGRHRRFLCETRMGDIDIGVSVYWITFGSLPGESSGRIVAADLERRLRGGNPRHITFLNDEADMGCGVAALDPWRRPIEYGVVMDGKGTPVSVLVESQGADPRTPTDTIVHSVKLPNPRESYQHSH